MPGAASALAAGNAGGEQTGQQQDGTGGTPAPSPTPTPTPAPAATEAWYQQAGIDPKFHDAIVAKGWQNPNDVLDSYTNVEKLVSLERGGDVDRILVRPKADATPEEIAAFRQKAGFAAPADVKDYGFTSEAVNTMAGELFVGSGLPPEAQQAFVQEMAPVVERAASWFKEAGLPPELAQPLVKAVLADEVKGITEFTQASDREYQTLSQQMGDKFGDFEEAGRRAFRASGLQPGMLDKIERAIGTSQMMTMFGKFGQAMTEAAAPQPGRTGTGQFTQSADSAKARIATLSKDSDFQAKLLSPNPEVRKAATAEWEQLHITAYPPS